MAKFFSLVIFFVTVPTVLFSTLFYLAFTLNETSFRSSFYSQVKGVSYAAIPTSEGYFKHSIVQKDIRVELTREFLSQYKSPLTQYTQQIIDAAQKYEIDYRLLPAIAMQESNLCKKIIEGSFNCWGYGIYGKKVTKFDSFPQAIDTVSKTLSSYKNTGHKTLAEIQSKYNPSNTGDWIGGVSHFMDQLQAP